MEQDRDELNTSDVSQHDVSFNSLINRTEESLKDKLSVLMFPEVLQETKQCGAQDENTSTGIVSKKQTEVVSGCEVTKLDKTKETKSVVKLNCENSSNIEDTGKSLNDNKNLSAEPEKQTKSGSTEDGNGVQVTDPQHSEIVNDAKESSLEVSKSFIDPCGKTSMLQCREAVNYQEALDSLVKNTEKESKDEILNGRIISRSDLTMKKKKSLEMTDLPPDYINSRTSVSNIDYLKQGSFENDEANKHSEGYLSTNKDFKLHLDSQVSSDEGSNKVETTENCKENEYDHSRNTGIEMARSNDAIDKNNEKNVTEVITTDVHLTNRVVAIDSSDQDRSLAKSHIFDHENLSNENSSKSGTSDENIIQEERSKEAVVTATKPSEVDDDFVSQISIVSVRGAVDDDVGNFFFEQTNEKNKSSDKGSIDDKVVCTPVDEFLKGDKGNPETVYQDGQMKNDTKSPEIRENDTDEGDATVGGDPFMIVDVRSLSETSEFLSEQNAIIMKEIQDIEPCLQNSLVNTKSINDKAKKPQNTSAVIDALQDMCTSVQTTLSASQNKTNSKHSSIYVTRAAERNNDSTASVPEYSFTNQMGMSQETPMPVISNVFSVKVEPEDYGEYSVANGKEFVKVGSVRGCKQITYSGVVKCKMTNKPMSETKRWRPRKVQVNSRSNSSFHFPPRHPPTKPAVLQIIKTPKSTKSVKPGLPQLIPPDKLTTSTTDYMYANKDEAHKTSLNETGVPIKNQRNGQSNSTTAITCHEIVHNVDNCGMEPMNIRNIGVGNITELIARKNPLPTYKPSPVPDDLTTVIKPKPHLPCYECGDSFLFKKSLHNHLSRRSMQIKYKCDDCKRNVVFTNKCQMLNHLRGHLNIHKTQAVPIHIKSDSIEISPFFLTGDTGEKEFEFFAEVPSEVQTEENLVEIYADRCFFCQHIYTSASDKLGHYKSVSNESVVKANIFCDVCPMYLDNPCSMKAHKAIHDLRFVNSFPELLVCPECGEQFTKNKILAFLSHLKMNCFHLSRFCSFFCQKCKFSSSCLRTMKNHLLSNLDIYYKCERCPMALRSVKNFYVHFSQKHGVLDNNTTEAKIIYRCHHCDTLIDDRNFLESHLESHLNEIKARAWYPFHCVLCGQIFTKKHLLEAHSVKHRAQAKRFAFCTFCSKDFKSPYEYVCHVLLNHMTTPSKVKVVFCDLCGLVCVGEKMLQSHPCLKKIMVYGDPEASKAENDEQKALSAKPQPTARNDGCKTNQKMILPKPRTPGIEVPSVQQTADFAFPVDFEKRCKACGIKFKNKVFRINHLKRHREENIFICISCNDDSFKTYHEVRSHEIVCAAVGLNGKTVGGIKQKAQTARKKTSPRKVKTSSDESELNVKLVPEAHSKVDAVHNDIELKCDQCEEVFIRKSRLEEHKKKDHGLHPCHLCGLMQYSELSLKKHLVLSHEGRKVRYSCFVCKGRKIERYFTEKIKLEKHLQQKHRLKQWDDSKIVPELPGLEGKSIKPETEKRKLETNQEDDKPQKKIKINNSGVFRCAKCLFSCENREAFLTHIKEHRNSFTVQCFECGLCFAVLPSLRKHLFIVHKVRDFETYCKENDIEEPQEANKELIVLNTDHSDTQEGGENDILDDVNPLECQVCYKEFDTEAGLKSHMRVHGMALIKRLRRQPNQQVDSTSTLPRLSAEDTSVSQDESKITESTETGMELDIAS